MRKSFTRLFSIFVLLLGLSLQMAYGIVFKPTTSIPTGANSNAKPADFATKFVVAFDVAPVISASGGTVVIYKNGGLFKTFPLTTAGGGSVAVVGTTLQVTHGIASFTAAENYSVAITDGAITGLASGALANGVYAFTIGDYVDPKLVSAVTSYTPNLGATNVNPVSPFSLVMTFDEPVGLPTTPGVKAVYVYKEDGTIVDIIKVGVAAITGLGTATITVPVAATAIFTENTNYYVSIDAGAFVDANVFNNKNEFKGLSTKTFWTFTSRDETAPAVSVKTITAITQTGATLNVTLSEKGKYYYAVYPAASTPTAADVIGGVGAVGVFGNKTVSAGGTSVSAALSGLDVAGGVAYKAQIVTENSVGIQAAAPVSEPFTTLDNTAPTSVNRGTLTDASKKTNALFMVFNEQIIGGTGSLDLRKWSDESYVKSIDASLITSSKITTAGDATKYGAAINNWVTVVDLGMTLGSKVDYYVVFPSGYIKDIAGNVFTAGSFVNPINKGDWSVTGSDFEIPTVTVAFVTPGSLSSAITVTFNETVAKQLGSTTDWAQVVALEQNNTAIPFTVLPAAAANTNVITLTPVSALSSNTVYTVKLRANAVKDLNNNAITTENLYPLTTGDLDVFAVQYGSSLGVTTTTNLVANSSIKIDLNKKIKVNTTGSTWVDADATNLKPFITFKKGATAKPFNVAYDASTFVITITPVDVLVCNANDYTVALDGAKVRDAQSTLLSAATGYVASQTYTVKDYNAPVATTSHNGDVATVMPLTITLADDNLATLTDLAGGVLTSNLVTFKEVGSNNANLAFAFAYNAGTGVITLTPTVPLAIGKTYYYGIGASVKDGSGNVTVGKFSTFTMITAAGAPTITATTYTVNGSAQTAVATKLVNIVPKAGGIVSVTVNFSDNVKEFTGNPVTLTIPGQPGSPFSVAITNLNVSGSVLAIDFTTGVLNAAASNAVITLGLPAALVQGSTKYDGINFAQFAGLNILFDAKDIVAPTASANTPTAAQSGVALNTPIKISFSEKVILGTGNILIKEGATTVQTIAVNSTNVSLDVAGTTATITKAGDLVKYNTTYTLEVPVAAFTDPVSLNPLGAAYSGTFTTLLNVQPSTSALLPKNGADMVASNSIMAITFSEGIDKNYTPGVLTLKGVYLVEKHDGNGTLSGPNFAFTANGGTDVLVASKYIDDSAVAISDNTVTINFGVALTPGKDYYIMIAPEAFKDKSTGTTVLGNPIPGLTSGIITSGVWDFTTRDVNAPTVTYAYTKRPDNKVSKTSDIILTFSKPIEKFAGGTIENSDIANLFTLTKLAGPGTLGVKAFVGIISGDKTVVTIQNSSLVTLGELTELSDYSVQINTNAVRGITNHQVLGSNVNLFTTSDYTAPIVTPSIVAAITDVKKDEATVQFVSTDNMNLATVYYTIQAGDASTVAPPASVVKADKSQAIVGASPKTVSYKFTGLTEETSYVVWAVVVDEAGNESAVNKVVFITDDATKPTLAVKPTSFDGANKLTFTFSEAVSPAAASVRILDKVSMVELAKLDLLAVAGAGNEKKLITTAFAGANASTVVDYYVEIDKGLVGDVPVVAGDVINYFDGLFRTDCMVSSKDNIAPSFVSTTPALPAVNVDLNFNIKLTFNEAVMKATVIPANAFLVEKWNGASYEAFEVIDPANVVTNGTSDVTVTLSRALASLSTYRLTFNLTSFTDLAGNAHAAGLVTGTIITKDVVAPAVTYNPGKNATNILTTVLSETLTFSKAITLLDGTAIDTYDLDSLVYFKKDGIAASFSATIDGTSKIITITPVVALVKDATYSYGFKAKFKDASGNIVPADVASFKTQTTTVAAQYLTWTPNSVTPPNTALGNKEAVTLTFTGPLYTNAPAPGDNLPVTPAYLATALVVTNNSGTIASANLVFTISADSKVVTVAPKAGTDWGSSQTITVKVKNSVLKINEGAAPGAIILVDAGDPTYFAQKAYAAADVIAPKVLATMDTAPFTDGYSPVNVGLAGVSPVISKTDLMKLYFDEDVKVGTGTVEIHRWDGVLAKSISNITVAGDKRTVTLGDLTGIATNQEYYAIVNVGTVTDLAGNNYAGLTAVKVWKFILKDDAVPQITAFMPNTSNTPVTTDLTISFDRAVALSGSGYVALYKSALGGDAVQIWRGADNGVTSAFSVSGSTATVNISDLDQNTQYFVELSAGTFKAATSLESQASIERSVWSFTTENNANPAITIYSPSKGQNEVDLNSDLKITFDMPVEAGTGNIQVHAADGSITYNFDVKGADVVFDNTLNMVTVSLPKLAENKQYYVIIPATAIRNKTFSPEYFGGVTVPYDWKFNTRVDDTVPTVIADPVTGTKMPKTFDVTLTFNEAVTGVVNANVTVNDGTVVLSTVTAGTVYKATIAAADADTVKLYLSAGIKDLATNSLVPVSFNYIVGDNTKPTAIVTPATGNNQPKVFTVNVKFNEDVTGAEAGITVNSAAVVSKISEKEYSVVVTAPVDNTTVILTLANTIKDLAGNAFAGATYTYKTGDNTAPLLITVNPNGGATIDAHPANLELFVNESVVKGTGKLTIYTKDGDVKALELDASTAVISVAGSTYKVSVPLTSSLNKFTDYYVMVSEGFVVDGNANKLAAVDTKTFWTFRTGDFKTDVPSVSLEFKVYPNPFVDYVDFNASFEVSKVIITNIAGQTVKQVVNPSQRIQLNELRSGVYFMSVYGTDNGVKSTTKIVKR